MSTYTAGYVPDKAEEVIAFLRRELSRIEQALNAAQASYELQIIHATPAKTRPGMVIYADGTDFNPGSGAGVYRRNAANSAWAYLG